MKKNLIRERWAAGDVAYGTLIELPVPGTAYMLGQAGYDWIVIEQQHAFTSQDDLLPLLHAVELGESTAIVRVGENDPIGISRALDLGARGIIAPMVNTREQAEVVAANTRFTPIGERSWGVPRLHESPEEANDDVLTFVMIETGAGAANIDEILSVEGIDGAVFGAADMAMSLGHHPRVGATSPDVWALFEKVSAACRRVDKHVGGIVTTRDMAEQMVAGGADFITFSADLWHLQAAVNADISTIDDMRALHSRSSAPSA